MMEIEQESPNTTSVYLDTSKLHSLVIILRESRYNRFEFCEQVECEMVEGFEKQNAYLDVVYQKLPSVLFENELKMVRLSREAYKADELLYKCSRSKDIYPCPKW